MLRGFDSEIFDTQAVFRKMLAAVAQPGSIMDMGIDLTTPGSIHPAAGAILLTLLDFETLFYSDLETGSEDIQWIKFHTGCPCTKAREKALFALLSDHDGIYDPEDFNQGTLESPHRSATVLVQTGAIHNRGGSLALTGPGIRTKTFLELGGVRESFWVKRNEMYQSYPLGIDMVFICDTQFVAVPRTSKVEIL